MPSQTWRQCPVLRSSDAWFPPTQRLCLLTFLPWAQRGESRPLHGLNVRTLFEREATQIFESNRFLSIKEWKKSERRNIGAARNLSKSVKHRYFWHLLSILMIFCPLHENSRRMSSKCVFMAPFRRPLLRSAEKKLGKGGEFGNIRFDKLGCTSLEEHQKVGPCNNTLLRRVLRRFFKGSGS